MNEAAKTQALADGRIGPIIVRLCCTKPMEVRGKLYVCGECGAVRFR